MNFLKRRRIRTAAAVIGYSSVLEARLKLELAKLVRMRWSACRWGLGGGDDVKLGCSDFGRVWYLPSITHDGCTEGSHFILQSSLGA